MESSVYTGEHL